MTGSCTCFVPGSPAPQGSKRHVGNGRMIESSKAVGPWRERVALAVHDEHWPQLAGPVAVVLEFVLRRPKSVPKTRTPAAIRRPDTDKLARAILDALTGIAFADDAQVIRLCAGKRLAETGETPGVHITLTDLTEADR
ncbi:RusA family crossover junction endodeoxyribonuclease [Nocardia terpenica]|uniref:Uncharacterized protein n=1 Tax=Nocardia terpenica TaxID=455432 RepID=A0A164JVX1_9NOCA|nr:RusA family crossover junction endodeoxyribonuclease [Nocardia terpenica]KZM70773.1 hypothetical protein AWN90_40160 [Nocardia terpenica]NQE89960.1 RusA family crossover junction endodeoxyribonuclease [Nocardia terpenica]